jgi:hypothetical protein
MPAKNGWDRQPTTVGGSGGLPSSCNSRMRLRLSCLRTTTSQMTGYPRSPALSSNRWPRSTPIGIAAVEGNVGPSERLLRCAGSKRQCPTRGQ